MRAGLMTVLAASTVGSASATAIGQTPSLPDASLTYTFSYVNTSTGLPSPLFPGQTARLFLTIQMSPPSGTPGTWSTTVSPSGSGTYRGIQSIFINLVGTGGAEGLWTDRWIDEE
ncbi:MAG: hypothetical protein WD749_12845 [Phycisphaerales bacterium]